MLVAIWDLNPELPPMPPFKYFPVLANMRTGTPYWCSTMSPYPHICCVDSFLGRFFSSFQVAKPLAPEPDTCFITFLYFFLVSLVTVVAPPVRNFGFQRLLSSNNRPYP